MRKRFEKCAGKFDFPVKPRYYRSVLIYCRAFWICSECPTIFATAATIFSKSVQRQNRIQGQFFPSLIVLKKVRQTILRQISGFYRERTLLIIGSPFAMLGKNPKTSLILHCCGETSNFRVLAGLGFFPSMAQVQPMTNK